MNVKKSILITMDITTCFFLNLNVYSHVITKGLLISIIP